MSNQEYIKIEGAYENNLKHISLAAMVSNTNEDIPEPETPVNIVICFFGIHILWVVWAIS